MIYGCFLNINSNKLYSHNHLSTCSFLCDGSFTVFESFSTCLMHCLFKLCLYIHSCNPACYIFSIFILSKKACLEPKLKSKCTWLSAHQVLQVKQETRSLDLYLSTHMSIFPFEQPIEDFLSLVKMMVNNPKKLISGPSIKIMLSLLPKPTCDAADVCCT